MYKKTEDRKVRTLRTQFKRPLKTHSLREDKNEDKKNKSQIYEKTALQKESSKNNLK